MIRGQGVCLVCGEPLVYTEEAQPMECVFCGKPASSNAQCESGHYVCDTCHAEKGVDAIMAYCSTAQSKNPIFLLQEMMEDPYIYMHGPEHHIMVGAALLTAFHNAGGELDFNKALKEMKRRGSACPGGTCGFWGCCGAAVSMGISMSIITGATPLSGKAWQVSNKATSRALDAIAELGGPRCCKRNSFTAVKVAAEVFKEEFGIELEMPQDITCDYSSENKQCRKQACPYYPGE